ncbi:MAG: ABC transporter ATP-binding protein [Alphaproteobacteria bacterium]
MAEPPANNPAPAGGIAVSLRQAAPIPLDAKFDCAPGELLALVGPSGSGKTTILRCIAGLVRPRNGTVRCGDDVWLDTERRIQRSPQDRRVGFVFQDYALFPHLSALDNVALAVGAPGRSARRNRAQALLAQVHLDGLEARKPAALSGGQRQRVALARALARDPAALLLDEPFAAVDQVTRRKLLAELMALHRRIAIPTILVTHDLNEAASLADRLCVLHRGVTLQEGTPDHVMNKPRDAQVAQLLDLANLFAGRVVEHRVDRGVSVLQWGSNRLEAALDTRFAPGAAVDWVIPTSYIVLHRPDRPSRGERENAVGGTIVDQTPFGDNTTLFLRVDGSTETLSFNVGTHTVRRNAIRAGTTLTVSLLADGIHLMPTSGNAA